MTFLHHSTTWFKVTMTNYLPERHSVALCLPDLSVTITGYSHADILSSPSEADDGVPSTSLAALSSAPTFSFSCTQCQFHLLLFSLVRQVQLVRAGVSEPGSPRPWSDFCYLLHFFRNKIRILLPTSEFGNITWEHVHAVPSTVLWIYQACDVCSPCLLYKSTLKNCKTIATS